MFENRDGDIEPCGGELEGYATRRRADGSLEVYRWGWPYRGQSIGVAHDWQSAVRLMEEDE